MKSKAGFLSLAEELKSYILSFLPWQDILRCVSVCKALRHTYMSSSELQYITELGGQRLIPVLNTDSSDHISFSERLKLLRDQAQAWFKLDIGHVPFGTVSIPMYFLDSYADVAMSLVNGHLCLWNEEDDCVTILPILPKPSQRSIERYWSPGSLCVPTEGDVFMDPAQDLIAIATFGYESGEQVHVAIGTLNEDGVHPEAAGRVLIQSVVPEREDGVYGDVRLRLKCFGKYIAVQYCRTFESYNGSTCIWSLQIWDWRHSTTSNSVLHGTSRIESREADFMRIDFCFLGNDWILVASHDLKLYSIEDMFKAPQLLTCFLLPVWAVRIRCIPPIHDNSRPQTRAQQTVWESDPKHQLLSIVMGGGPHRGLLFIISTRVFANLDMFGEMRAIPWEYWGPLNARIFAHRGRIGIRGNRVLRAFNVGDREFEFHVMDFSPLAIKHRQGLGRVVREPSTVELRWGGKLTTYLPYVEVSSGKKSSFVNSMWVDVDRVYLLCGEEDDFATTDQLQVLEI
ncbi:hypothetical protein K503DRAFT_768069 [Rhizopogon vinicolor AM-OR11-026]|uniref:F-box domain-containing protein n=1 Tax=Rhizopogon vinicolor AM-OR11-026 TaxID=1314800 RepID=A0A1B7N846_9AGAM|nr:hypothetical protein K503DRAFT_768069 [Rhizopogon vinicolor AM-OR11-026]